MPRRTDARSLTPERVGEIVAPVMERWGAARAWLYGSVARGDQHQYSDVDLIVEMLPDVRLGWGIVTFQDELEDVLNLPVDLHTPPDRRRTNPAFLRNFDRAKVMVYERQTE